MKETKNELEDDECSRCGKPFEKRSIKTVVCHYKKVD